MLPFSEQLRITSSLFAQNAPLVVEIGFGMGGSLLEMATKAPDLNFLGIEVHQPGVGKLLQGIVEREITNLKIICHDAKEVIEHNLADGAVSKFQIFFPDPWHKKRHNKRRLIQPEFVERLEHKLLPGGQIHLATDWQPYAEHMMEVLSHSEALSNEAGLNEYWENPDRPSTKFEARGLRLGHGVWDLCFRKH